MNQPSADELRKFRHAAEEMVRETRSIIMTALSNGFSHQLKPDGSFVTEVDLAVEDLIRSRIHAAFPDHGIVGEERAESSSESGYLWFVDPVDGTHSLRHRIPLFGTMLALQHRGRPLIGVIDLPALDQTYIAASGLGAQCNGQSIQLANVESESAVEHEIIAVGERKQFIKCGQEATFDHLIRSHPSVRTYCDCFGHALAIRGSVGAMVDYNLHIWDIAATEVLIREVGGACVLINADESRDTRDNRYNVVFGKPTVVGWVLKTLEPGTDG